MNANNMKTQIFHKMKYGLRGHTRSLKAILCLSVHFISDIGFLSLKFKY